MNPVVPFPEKVMVQTSSRCNATCRFCPYPKLADTLPQGVMEEPLFRRIIDECAEHQHELKNIMLYLMNEPLLDPHIVDRINYTRARIPEVELHILTNGSLLTDKRADALVDSGLSWIGISIHGYSDEVYRASMGLKREVTYRRVERFIDKAIVRRGPAFVMVTFNGSPLITPEERDAELSHFRELGVKRLSFFGSSISRAGNVQPDVVQGPTNTKIFGCTSIWWPEMAHVLFNGDAILCCMDWKREVVVGNLGQMSLHELWHSDAYRRVRSVVAGELDLPAGFPCSRCEEAMLEPRKPVQTIDVGLVVLPCAVLDSDASSVPGVQAVLRRVGLSETLVDLSDRVYREAGTDHSSLWHRAGHGVVHHGDGSELLIEAKPDVAEWCAARAREVAADHLVLLLCRANRAMVLEAVRRIKERDPGRSILVFGTDQEPDRLLLDFGVPYLHDQRGKAVARWIAETLGHPVDPNFGLDRTAGEAAGTGAGSPVDPDPDPVSGHGKVTRALPGEQDGISQPSENTGENADPRTQARPVEPPWRPPEWEGTGAGMVPPDPAEDRPSPVGRWLESLQAMAHTLRSAPRRPLIAISELRKQGREAVDAMVGLVVRPSTDSAGTGSGVPGGLAPLEGAGPDAHRPPPGAREVCLNATYLDPGKKKTDRGAPTVEDLYRTPPETETPPETGTEHEREHEHEHEHKHAHEREHEHKREHTRDAGADDVDAAVALADKVEEAACVALHPQVIRGLAGAEVLDPPPPGEVPVPETPWQNRPDQGRPIDVILGTLPPWGFQNPPVGLAHLATYARQQGYGVEVLDLNIDLYHRLGPEWQLLWHVENKNYWSNDTTYALVSELLAPHMDAYATLIAEHEAPLVGLSVVDPKERATIDLIRRVKAKNPEKRFLLGGPACVTPEYRQIFVDKIPELIDGYAMGEGEGNLVACIEAVREGRSLDDLPGIYVVRDGQALPYRRRKRLEPLDLVPFPLYEDFLMERYPGDELIVEWSRGCIGACSYCKGKMIDGKFRSHSAYAIYEAMLHYAEWLELKKFTICDPVINGDVEVMRELCDLLAAADLGITWRGEAIPHAGLTAELLQSMARAGCVELQLGLECGSDKVLELMRKRRMFSVADAEQVVRDCHDAGIRTALFIIIGFPGEEEEDFQATYDFVARNHEHIDELKSINSLHIITDTPVHMKPDKYNLVFPERDCHYKWSTRDGRNTIEVRNDRIRRLKALADEHGIFVRETNLAEGKHYALQDALAEAEAEGEGGDRLALLKEQVNKLQSV